jgi:hypothetical protein
MRGLCVSLSASHLRHSSDHVHSLLRLRGGAVLNGGALGKHGAAVLPRGRHSGRHVAHPSNQAAVSALCAVASGGAIGAALPELELEAAAAAEEVARPSVVGRGVRRRHQPERRLVEGCCRRSIADAHRDPLESGEARRRSARRRGRAVALTAE